MNRDDILKQCCDDTCIWNDDKTCHKINIRDIKILEDDLKFLATIKVHTLDLFDNNIGDNGAKYLSQNKTIHTLYLLFNNIGENGAKYFLKAIIPDLHLSDKYADINKISKQNYVKYMHDTEDVILRYILRNLTCIIMNYVKND